MTEPSHAVFLSYASQDTQAAQRICEALRAAGIEVWFDRSELRGGDAWDQSIRDQINACALFIPLISANAHARVEGYFRLEWKLAIDRSHRMAPRQPFLLPVVIDDTRRSDDAIPDRFRDLQWTHLHAGEVTPAFVERVTRLLGLRQSAGPTTSISAAVSTSTASVHDPRRSGPALLVITALIAVALVYFGVERLSSGKRAASVVGETTDTKRTIAVLPFLDLSEKHDQEYFADGMAEEIIDLLTKVPELKVIGRTSAFEFKGKIDDLRKIGTTLGATYVVEGTVRRSGKLVRITARLTDTRDGTYRWSENYDRDVSDVLKVQEEVALAVVRALQLEVASTVFRGAQSARPSADAYDEYLRGLHARDRFDQRGFEEALAHFRHALQLEPSFSPAEEAAASTLYYMAESAYLPPQSGFTQARAAAEAALKLDPQSSVAHAVICIVNTIFDWDWSAAARECAIAERISPNQPFVLQAAAVQRMALGQWKAAAASIEAAITNDPLDPASYNIAGRIYVRAGRMREAETAVRRALQISPTSTFNHHLLGITLLLQGKATEALAEMRQESSPGAQALGLVLAYHALHRERDADAALANLIAENGTDWAFSISEAYAFRAQKDSAFAWLERAFAQRDEDLFAVKGSPLLKNLEVDPRYKAFLRKMNLPEMEFDTESRASRQPSGN